MDEAMGPGEKNRSTEPADTGGAAAHNSAPAGGEAQRPADTAPADAAERAATGPYDAAPNDAAQHTATPADAVPAPADAPPAAAGTPATGAVPTDAAPADAVPQDSVPQDTAPAGADPAGTPASGTGKPKPLHDPDPYGTPPYGEPGPWAPAPPVQHPSVTPPHGTRVPPPPGPGGTTPPGGTTLPAMAPPPELTPPGGTPAPGTPLPGTPTPGYTPPGGTAAPGYTPPGGTAAPGYTPPTGTTAPGYTPPGGTTAPGYTPPAGTPAAGMAPPAAETGLTPPVVPPAPEPGPTLPGTPAPGTPFPGAQAPGAPYPGNAQGFAPPAGTPLAPPPGAPYQQQTPGPYPTTGATLAGPPPPAAPYDAVPPPGYQGHPGRPAAPAAPPGWGVPPQGPPPGIPPHGSFMPPPGGTGGWAADPWAAPFHQNGAVPPALRRREGRRGLVTVLFVVVALVAGGLGGVVGTYAERHGADTDVDLPALSDGAREMPPDSVAKIAKTALPSVVTLHVKGAEEQDTGTGFVLDGQGRILTNNHVIQPAVSSGEISVTFSDGRTAKGTVVGHDSGYDLAVVKVSGVSDVKPLTLGDSDGIAVGDPVVAIGSPFDLPGTVTSGIVSAKERPITAGGESEDDSDVSYVDAIQTDAPINPGNSGGPLVDEKARVIGINSAIRSGGGGDESEGEQGGSIGLGFAIPINQAKRIATELIDTGTASHPVIGVTLDNQYLGDGAKVAEEGQNGDPAVTRGGPGDKAGIVAGDVITEVDGKPVHSGDELIVKIRSHRPGDHLALTLRRHGGNGKKEKVTLVLGEAKGN
ncbi:trypsin-like peptidase domain-containing protein [Streptomyces sp. NPDC050560]|uniref:S1C family serine protease n=1 Tax=Streptomyces sp. NPDC050560 TaxID=3365630 RepID=UPI0037B5CF3C